MHARSNVLVLSFLLTLASAASAQPIVNTDGSPFAIKRGMTLKQAIQSLQPDFQTYALGGDTGWQLQIHNGTYDDVLMTLWCDESQDYVINYAAKVTAIAIYSPNYRTKDGIRVGMLLSDVEKKLGKLKRIFTSELTSQEYAEFTRMPDGVGFGISGGVFKENQRETQKYSNGARITRIDVSFW